VNPPKGDEMDDPGLAQEQVEAIVSKTAEDLQKKLGEGGRVIIMTGKGVSGNWGYCWSTRGDLFSLLGLMEHVGSKVRTWIGSTLG
jgi:hypothetical protein